MQKKEKLIKDYMYKRKTHRKCEMKIILVPALYPSEINTSVIQKVIINLLLFIQLIIGLVLLLARD